MKADGYKLDLIMARSCIKKGDIIKDSGVSASTLERAFKGLTVKPVTLGKIAAALKVDVTQIIREV